MYVNFTVWKLELTIWLDLDKVDLGNGLVVNNQTIGVANTTSGFDGSFDGILGIGPVDLTEGTVSDATFATCD